MAPVLGYWSMRGLAQPIRYLLAYTGTEFEDKQYDKGPPPDYSKAKWTDDIDRLGLEFPNLPYYVDGDVSITETDAILRYLAQKTNLGGSTDKETVRINMAASMLNEIGWDVLLFCYRDDFEQKKASFIENSSSTLQKLSKLVGTQNFIMGTKVTFVDFLLLEILDRYEALAPDCLTAYPSLKAFQQRVKELPAIKKYLDSPAFQKISNRLCGRTAKFGTGTY